MSGFLYSHI